MITYSLKSESSDYEKYYFTIKKLGDDLIDKALNKSSKYIDDFKLYLKSKNIEDPKDSKYYSIEIILIGVLFREYKDYILNFKPYLSPIYNILNKSRNSKFKPQIDVIRGRINTSLYSKSQKLDNPYTLNNFSRLIKWLDATYDFKDEVLRLNIWHQFLKEKASQTDYIREFFNLTDYLASYLKYIGDENLKCYLPNLDNYLNSYLKTHKNKEDIVYCGKTSIQYYFNMILSEVMNDIFREDFLNTDKKIVFLPGCMTQTHTPCKRISTSYGGKCKHCSRDCNVNRIDSLGDKYNFDVYIIKHETTLSSLDTKNNKNIGIVGIACIPNLITGGFKALRLGFMPQCVLLDYSGCSNHWLDKRSMTSINEKRLLEIITRT